MPRGDPSEREAAQRWTWPALAGLLALAAALRWLQWSRSVTIFNDGPLFLDVARAIAEGDWGSALAQPHHLLYPALIALAHGLGLAWEPAAASVAVAAGTAAVGVAFVLLRDLFGPAAAWIGAGLLAIHSRAVEYSSDVQTDGPYLALFLAGVWLSWRAWNRASPGLAACAGVAAGLAYLTRPEGIGLVGVALALAGIAWTRGWWSAALATRWTVACACAAALCAGPYVVALGHTRGAWTLTQKKSVRAMLGGEAPAPTAPLPAPLAVAPASPPWSIAGRADRGEDGLAVVKASSRGERALAAARMLARTARSALRYGPLALLVAGLAAARGRPSRRGVFVCVLLAAYGAVLYALTYQQGYVSRRHALPPLVPLLGYAGLGALALGTLLARGRAERARALAAAIAVAVAGGELLSQVEPRRADERAARAAAEWLRDHGEPGPVAADRLRLGYYAGMPYIPLARVDDPTLGSFLDRAGARYVLLDDPADIEALRRIAGDRFRPLHRETLEGQEAWVFERAAPAP
jgi:hypothetical protein